MLGMASVLLLFRIRRQPVTCRRSQEFFRRQAEPLNGRVDPGPLLGKEPLTFALQQQTARADVDEHTETSSLLDQLFVAPLLISLENRKRINPARAHCPFRRASRYLSNNGL